MATETPSVLICPFTGDAFPVDHMEAITVELNARAKYVVGEVVRWHQFARYVVIARYWRRSVDAFVYDLQDAPGPNARRKVFSKVPEHEIMPVR